MLSLDDADTGRTMRSCYHPMRWRHMLPSWPIEFVDGLHQMLWENYNDRDNLVAFFLGGRDEEGGRRAAGKGSLLQMNVFPPPEQCIYPPVRAFPPSLPRPIFRNAYPHPGPKGPFLIIDRLNEMLDNWIKQWRRKKNCEGQQQSKGDGSHVDAYGGAEGCGHNGGAALKRVRFGVKNSHKQLPYGPGFKNHRGFKNQTPNLPKLVQ